MLLLQLLINLDEVLLMKKNLLSAVLAVTMAFSSFSLSVSANFNEGNITTEVSEYNCLTGETRAVKLPKISETFSPAFTPNASIMDYGDDISPNSLIDGSPIERVPNVTSAPYCKVVFLRMGFDKDNDGVAESWSSGTGFMVKNRVMLTAAHNLWHSENEIWPKSVLLYTKLDGNDTSYMNKQPETAIGWTYPKAYASTQMAKDDWCVVQTKNEVGKTTGYFGYGVPTTSLVGTKVSVNGYPLECYQFYSKGAISKVDTDFVYYKASTDYGMSGGPVYDSNYTVWAIHTNGNSSANYGPKINSTIMAAITKYNT